MNLGLALHQSALRAPQALAVADASGSLTYAELDERTARLANLLRDRFAVGIGDRVALLVANRREVIEVLGGCAKAGAVYCGINFRLGEPEYDHIFVNAAPKVVITDDRYLETARRQAQRLGIPVVNVDDDGPRGYRALLAAASAGQPAAMRRVRPEDEFCIVYTSGTTARPKGVLFTVEAVMQHALASNIEFEVDASTRWLVVLPHNSSVQITFVPLLLIGGAVCFSDSLAFDPHRFVDEVRRHSITHTFLVPTVLFRLLEAGYDASAVPTLGTVGYGSSPIPPDRVGELVRRFGSIFIQLYGLAEICSVGTMLRKADHDRALAGQPELLSSCGRPSYLIAARTVDDEGNDVPAGEPGEVLFGGPYLMKAYNGDPQRTAETIVDGWMHTGDLGRFDEDGYLSIIGRKKDLIIRGGFNIAPAEVEAVLARHPAVLEAAVFGVPDSEWGESVCAAIVLSRAAEVDPEALREHCRRSEIASIKVPERFFICDELPRTATGKPAKNELRASYGAPAG